MADDKTCPHCGKPVPPTALSGICPECMLKAGLAAQTEGPGGATKVVQPPPSPAEIASLFPQLEILECLGRGGMGVVYKARQPRLNRLVALKILARDKEQDGQFAERFTREAQTLARLNHPNIVTVHDFGEAGGHCYLVMEFVDGLNLRQLLLTGKMPPDQALTIVPMICEALQYAHEQGIVHRDIKPENILLDKQGRVKIADFGIAKMLGVETGHQALTGAKDVMGTPHYMAPEQVEKPLTVDHRADIYSLGVVFYEMLTGELPLGKFAPPSKKVQIDVRLDEVVLHTLEKEPERRYQQASQLKTDVETIAGTVPPAAGFGAKGDPSPLSATPSGKATSDKIILPAFLLAFFFGVFGAHRFYVGKYGTAILQLCTFGACGIWAVIDWILILCKAFTDGQGRRITNWFHPKTGELQTVSPVTGPPSTPPPGGAAPSAAGIPPAPIAPEKTAAPGTGKIMAPAVGLMVAAGLDCFGIGSPFHGGDVPGFITVLLKVVPACLIFFGALKMMQLRSYAWAIAASILAIVCCSLVGFPVGIWALVVLSLQSVRKTFARQPKPQPAPARIWPWFIGVAVIIGVIVIGVMVALMVSYQYHPVATARVEKPNEPDSQQNVPVQKGSSASNIVATNGGSGMALNISSQNGQVVIETTNSRLSADKVQLQADPKGALTLTASKIESAVSPATPTQTTVAVETTKRELGKDPQAGANSTSQTIDVGVEANFSRSLSVASTGTLTMNVDRGDIRVTGSDQNTVEVQVDREVTRADDSEAARILKEERLVVKQTGNEISITAHDPPSLHRHSLSRWWGWVSQPNLVVHYEITVPRKFDVQLETSCGGIKIASLQGNVNVKTEGGGLDFNDIEGRVNGRTEGGGIRAVSCKNELLIQTEGGGITIERFAGSGVRAITEGGSISADFAAAPKADCELRTEGGSITARLPHIAAITLDAHTEGGTVRTDLPVQVEGQFHGSTLKGTINGGGPLLKLATEGGSIAVLKQ